MRAKTIRTIKTIKQLGYKGQWFVVDDDMNGQLDEYKKIIPKNNLLIFKKSDIKYDSMLPPYYHPYLIILQDLMLLRLLAFLKKIRYSKLLYPKIISDRFKK